MTIQTYDEQLITRYLLGSLSEDEAVRLDELSFTDEEFADALKGVENDLVDAYVRGELSDQTLKQFESFYLASPLRREKIEFAQAFQQFAEKAGGPSATTSQEAAAEPRMAFSGLLSTLKVLTVPRPALQWGLVAATFVFLLGGGWLVYENLRLRQQMSQTQARRDQLLQREQELQKEIEGQRLTNARTEQELAQVREERARLEQELKKAQQGTGRPSSPGEGSIVSLILAPPLRGAGGIPTVTVPTGTSLVTIQLQLEAADYSAYRVALIDPSNNQTIWRSGNLKPRARGNLSLGFRAALVKPQNYILRVSGVSTNGTAEIVSDYSFKVAK